MWKVKPDVPIPLLPSFGVHFIRWLQEDPLTFLIKHTTSLSLMDGVNLLTTREHQADNFLLLQAGSSSVTVMRLPPPPSTVVSVLLGGCNAGCLSSTGSPEPGGDKAEHPASTLVELVLFSSEAPIVLLDHAGRGAGVWCVCARVSVHTKQPIMPIEDRLFYRG